jgi:antitoxin component of RelBE/YafQ-DinJ toxin-antitoxin module
VAYIIQINDEVREATPDEAAIIDAQFAEAAKIEADRKAKEEARAAVLAKLGLTADEAAALLG